MEQKNIIITYDTLFDLSRRERYRPEIQKLEETFFTDVVKYLDEKNAILESQEENQSVFAATETEKTKTQIINAKKILKELYERREGKIIQTALFHSRNSENPPDFSTMLLEEQELFKEIEKILVKYRQEILLKLLEGKFKAKPKDLKTEVSKEVQGNLVCLKCQVPEFVGPDMEGYGPFSEGDKVELPDNIAEMLIKNGHAVRLENEDPENNEEVLP